MIRDKKPVQIQVKLLTHGVDPQVPVSDPEVTWFGRLIAFFGIKSGQALSTMVSKQIQPLLSELYGSLQYLI